MNLIRENIKNVGMKPGKSVRGKGIEVWNRDEMFHSGWSSSIQDGSFLEKVKASMEKRKLHCDGLIITEFYSSKEKRYLREHEFPPVEDVIFWGALEFCTEIELRVKGVKLYGYIPESKYDVKDIDSMKNLCAEVIRLSGVSVGDEILDEWGEFESEIEFKDKGQACSYGYHSRYSDHVHFHGGLIAMNPELMDVVEFDGRVCPSNDMVLDDFWNMETDWMQENLNEMDPLHHISVYHRKGKDWFVGFTVDHTDFTVEYKEGREVCSEQCYVQTYFRDTKLRDEIAEYLKSFIPDLEIKCAVYNEANLHTYMGYNEGGDIFNLDMVESICESTYDFAHEVLEYIDYDGLSTKHYSMREQMVIDGYNEWIKRNVPRLKESMAKLIFAGENLGYKYLETEIPGTKHEIQQCFSYKGEEYHFSYKDFYKDNFHIGKLIVEQSEIKSDFENRNKEIWRVVANTKRVYQNKSWWGKCAIYDSKTPMKLQASKDLFDEDMRVAERKFAREEDGHIEEFIEMVQKALTRRLLEKIEFSTLLEKAKFIFVGFEDSLSSGNCKSGTEQFCARNKIDTKLVGGIRGDVLLNMELTNYTRRAVHQALSSHGKGELNGN